MDWDTSTFRALGHDLIDYAARYIESAEKKEIPVLKWKAPSESKQDWKLPDVPLGKDALFALIKKFYDESTHLHHPHFVGHQVGVAPPLTVLADLIAGTISSGTGVYEMAPPGVMTEFAVVEWMTKAVGYPDTADGFFTSGGTIGNTTALLAARAKHDPKAWDEGNRAPYCFLASKFAHYSVDRSTRVMGLGKNGIIGIPTDENFTAKPSELSATLDLATREGRKVIGVVASCSNTALGTYDPIEPMADFCEKHGLWLHVDGAHGASAALSPKYRYLVKGIERADSIVWDTHKMMMTPVLSTGVLFKERRDSFLTFQQEASYLFQKAVDEEWFNPCGRTFETTKGSIALRLYLLLAYYGPQLLSDFVTRNYDLARSFAAEIKRRPGFELAVEPQANIVCFRYGDNDDLQAQIRRKIIESGRFYLVQTRLPKGLFLRTSLMNPTTTESHLGELLSLIRETASSLV